MRRFGPPPGSNKTSNNNTLIGYTNTPKPVAYKYYRKESIMNTWDEISKDDLIDRLQTCLGWDCKIEDVINELHKRAGSVGMVTGWAKYKAERV